MNIRPGRWATAALAVTLSMLVGATLATPASAYTIARKSGYPGSATVPKVVGEYLPATYSNRITAPQRTVYESPQYAGFNQYVCAQYRLWYLARRSDNTQYWVRDPRGGSSCAWISAAGTSARLTGLYWDDNTPYTAYGVDVVITWQLANGTVVGSKTYDYSDRADYACVTAKCVTGSSTVGGYVQFDFL